METQDRKREGYFQMLHLRTASPPAEDRPMETQDRKREGYF